MLIFFRSEKIRAAESAIRLSGTFSYSSQYKSMRQRAKGFNKNNN